MSTNDFDFGAYWSEPMACYGNCDTTHTRMEYHSLGMSCGRCGEHTGNNSQGHYWGLCKDERFRAEVEAKYAGRSIPFNAWVRELHFCCPGNCELESP